MKPTRITCRDILDETLMLLEDEEFAWEMGDYGIERLRVVRQFFDEEEAEEVEDKFDLKRAVRALQVISTAMGAMSKGMGDIANVLKHMDEKLTIIARK